MITKNELDKLVQKYENKDFIKDDPVQFIHKFKTKKWQQLRLKSRCHFIILMLK